MRYGINLFYSRSSTNSSVKKRSGALCRINLIFRPCQFQLLLVTIFDLPIAIILARFLKSGLREWPTQLLPIIGDAFWWGSRPKRGRAGLDLTRAATIGRPSLLLEIKNSAGCAARTYKQTPLPP